MPTERKPEWAEEKERDISVPMREGDPSSRYRPSSEPIVADTSDDEGFPFLAESLRAWPRGVGKAASDITGLAAALTGGIGRMMYDTGDAELINHFHSLAEENPDSTLAAHMDNWQQMNAEDTGFFKDFEGASAETFNAINSSLGNALSPSRKNIEQLSDAQLAAIGVQEFAGAVGVPVAGIFGAAGKGVRAANAARKGGGALTTMLRGAGATAKEAAKDPMKWVYGGTLGGAGVGASVKESDAESPEGRLADFTQGAGMGGLLGLLSTAGAKLLVHQADALTNYGIKKLQGETADALASVKADIDPAREMMRSADIKDVPLVAGTPAASATGKAWRHSAMELGEEKQLDYNRAIAKGKAALGERQKQQTDMFQREMGSPPAPLGTARTVNVTDEKDAAMNIVNISKKNLDRSASQLNQRYQNLEAEFGQIKVKGFQGRHITGDMWKGIKDRLQVGDALEAEILGKVIPGASSQTTDAMMQRGGFKRLMESIARLKKEGKTAEGMPGSVVSNFVHNANEIMRMAESSGNAAHQMRARQLVDYAYGLMDEMAEQGIFPKSLVQKFRDTQGAAREHYRKFYGGSPIAQAMKEHKNASDWEIAASLKNSLMTRGGNMREENIHALYDTVGNKDIVDDFIANTIHTIYDNPKDFFKFYEQNKRILNSPDFPGLAARADDIFFDTMAKGFTTSGETILDFVRNVPENQVKKFTQLVLGSGTDAYKYMGYRVLDEVAKLPLRKRMRYIEAHGQRIESMLSTPIGGKAEMAEAFTRLKTFNAFEEILNSHKPFDVIEAQGPVGKAYQYLAGRAKDALGITAVAGASAIRAVVRRIVAVTTALWGMLIPRIVRQRIGLGKHKQFTHTLGMEIARDEVLEGELLKTIAGGKITDGLHAFLRTMVYNMGQTAHQPARFSQERLREIEGEREAEYQRLMGSP